MCAPRYLYLLYGQRAKLNPQHAVLGMMPGNPGFEGAVRHARSKDVELQSTVFLWGSYKPRTYYWEVLEMLRKMFLTGAIVFVSPGTPTQVSPSSWFCVNTVCLGCKLRSAADSRRNAGGTDNHRLVGLLATLCCGGG